MTQTTSHDDRPASDVAVERVVARSGHSIECARNAVGAIDDNWSDSRGDNPVPAWCLVDPTADQLTEQALELIDRACLCEPAATDDEQDEYDDQEEDRRIEAAYERYLEERGAQVEEAFGALNSDAW